MSLGLLTWQAVIIVDGSLPDALPQEHEAPCMGNVSRASSLLGKKGDLLFVLSSCICLLTHAPHIN